MDYIEFTQLHFNGDVDAALRCLAYEGYSQDFKLTGNCKNLKEIIDTLDETLANKYMEYFNLEIKKNPERHKQVQKMAWTMTMMGEDVSYEKIRDTTENPYKARLLKLLKILLIGTIAIIVLVVVLKYLNIWHDVVIWGVGIFTLFAVYDMSEISVNLINYFRFKKVKRMIDENERRMLGNQENHNI